MTMTRKLGLSYEEELMIAREEARERAKEAEERGITQGLTQGLSLGLRSLLVQQIETKFGSVPVELRRRIEACSDDGVLRSAGVQLLLADSVDELEV